MIITMEITYYLLQLIEVKAMYPLDQPAECRKSLQVNFSPDYTQRFSEYPLQTKLFHVPLFFYFYTINGKLKQPNEFQPGANHQNFNLFPCIFRGNRLNHRYNQPLREERRNQSQKSGKNFFLFNDHQFPDLSNCSKNAQPRQSLFIPDRHIYNLYGSGRKCCADIQKHQ